MKNVNYACNSYGNMKEITSSQDRMKKYSQKAVGRKKSLRGLVRVAIAAGMVAAAGIMGVVEYVHEYRNPSETYVEPQDESVAGRRARQLAIANAQLMTAETAEETNGLSSVITDIQSGAYDY